MKSAVEPLEGNKVKLSVEVDAAEFEAAIDAAVQQGDFGPMETLLTVLSTPFDLKPPHAEYSAPPAPSERVRQTFCGT